MKYWKLVPAYAGIVLACLFAIPVVWAGQVPNPVNAPASVTTNAIAFWNGTNPQGNLSSIATANNSIFATNGAGVPAWTTTLPGGIAIPAGDLPLPTISTLGALESIACPSHQWIDVIPTTQVQPTCAQPAFTDISGITIFAQHPAIAAGDLYGNATGSTAAPADTTLTALIDQALGNGQGDILYRSASAWSLLPPGTANQVLQTGGASANPGWAERTAPLSVIANTSPAGGATDFEAVMGVQAALITAEQNANQIWPQSGSFTAPATCGVLKAAAGTGNTYTWTLRINGATPTGGPVCTFSGTSTAGTGSGSAASITAGQTVDWQTVQSASSSAAVASVSLVFSTP